MFFRISAVTLLIAICLYWFCVRIQPEDSTHYQKLMTESVELRTRKALEQEPAYQKRQGVQKDLWTQNGTRHFCIQSQTSGLTIRQKKDKIEATETLRNIECITPNGIKLMAEEGIYDYPSHQFIAQKNCRLEQGENHIAGSRIHLDLSVEKMTLENPKGRIESGELDFTAKTLLWEKNNAQIYLIDDVRLQQKEDLVFLANRGIVYLKEYKPTLVILEDNVRLISSHFQGKESYAMADRLSYDPIAKTILFKADRRVLFWQDGLTLSASEVLIRQDETIEGHGDVHFTFDMEEQNQIDAFFKQYL